MSGRVRSTTADGPVAYLPHRREPAARYFRVLASPSWLPMTCLMFLEFLKTVLGRMATCNEPLRDYSSGHVTTLFVRAAGRDGLNTISTVA